jgi:hypothetical protein
MNIESCCEYCGEVVVGEGFSIPLNDSGTKWSGYFCSRQCRLSANRYIADFPRRSLQEWTLREEWIRSIDAQQGAGKVAYAPEPNSLARWNPINGKSRAQWLPNYNQTEKLKY